MKQTNRKTSHMFVARNKLGTMYINLETRKFYWLDGNFDRSKYNAIAYRGCGIPMRRDTLEKAKAGTRII